VALLALLLAPSLAAAQSREIRTVRAVRTDQALTIDGDLSEAAWSEAVPGTGFRQREPKELEPATEDTEFRVVRTDTFLYIGVEARDSEPHAIVAGEMERDAPLYRDDSIAIVLDTFGDRRNAYTFETNPNCARFDALITDEGRDINRQWDGVWWVACRRTSDGWIAEFGIPFSTLRFDPALDAWGINVRRMIRRKSEEVNWAPLGRDIGSYRDLAQYAVYRISLAGTVEGMRGIEPAHPLNVKPFLVGELTRAPGADGGSTRDDGEVGLDLKWGVTRSLALDLTYNTDFAEVEADQQQVNLTRFSLFFPEKREFFLENAGIFEFGLPQRDSFEPPLMKVFFSRRIGLDQGRQVPIDYGVRMTGRAGDWNIGVLDVLTEETGFDGGSTVPDGNFGVVRLKRNLGRRSGLGLIYTDRNDRSVGRNQVYGVDLDYKPSRATDLAAFWSDTRDDDTAGDSWAAGASGGYRSTTLEGTLDWVRVNEGYQPDAGFLLRRDFERFTPRLTWRPLIGRWGLRSWFTEARYDYFARASSGELESRRIEIAPIGLGTFKEDGFGLYYDWDTERLFRPFEIRPGIVIPPGLYQFESARLGGRTNESRRVSLRGRLTAGDFFDGTRDWYSVTMRLRISRNLRAETSLDYNDVDLPAGAFITRILGQRFDVSFSPDLRLNAFLQYNDAAELVGANVRFNWSYRP
ncbi:MAG TPA: DUF5916 domain-containing protein, partial [Thermoanaerobaculia bacterium]|nr:DUF5916 domain-containing protein [Thermoanaerobaculia bacterium]